MCHERYMRPRRQADESENIWQEFEQTGPTADPERPPDPTAPEPTEASEEVAVAQR
jgi:hypothetical protein